MIWLLDGVLVALILVLAWRCLQTEDLFQAVVLFIALGLLIALAWTRLHVPDAALAEAAIGSGLAGALLLSTLSRLNAEVALPVSNQAWLVWPWRLVWLGLAGGLALGAWEVQAYWVLGVLLVSSLLNALYFLPLLHRIWFVPAPATWPHEQVLSQRLETHWMLLWPPLITAMTVVALGLMAGYTFATLGWVQWLVAQEFGGLQ